MIIFQILAILAIVLILTHFIFYPLFLIISTLRPVKENTKLIKDYLPTVCLMIAAKDEEKGIRKKIENSLELDYPKELLKILVVPNGCTDKTADIAREYAEQGIEVIEYGPIGKSEAQNKAVELVNSEIIIFSDADAIYQVDAIRKMVSSFADPKVGAVEGEHNFTKVKSLRGKFERFYWILVENTLKKAESRSGNIVGANGTIYAIRRELYEAVNPACTSDFIVPLLAAAKGYKVVFNPEAKAFENANTSIESEYNRKKRVVRHGLSSLLMYPWLLNPLKTGKIAVQLFCHKILRWFFPFLLMFIILNSILRIGLKKAKIHDYLVFSSASGLGFLATLGRGLGSEKPVPLLSHAYYVFLILKALTLGVFEALTKGGITSWTNKR